MEPTKQTRYIIYCHTHIDSGRRYIGLTSRTMNQRWNDHVYAAMRKSKGGRWHFPNAIRKYGKNAFSHAVLEICDNLELANLAEERWINHFNTRDPEFGFNLAKGGEHIPHPIRKNPWDDPEFRARNLQRFVDAGQSEIARSRSKAALNTPESRAKRSAATKVALAQPETIAKRVAMRADPAYNAKIAASLKSTLSAPAVREHMSAVAKECLSRPEIKAKMSAAIREAMSRPEVRAKLAETSKAYMERPEIKEKYKNRVTSEETKAKIAATSRGRRHSPESLAKMSELAKARWADPCIRAAHADGIQRARQHRVNCI